MRTIDVCDSGRITAIEQSKDKRSFRELARKRVCARARERNAFRLVIRVDDRWLSEIAQQKQQIPSFATVIDE